MCGLELKVLGGGGGHVPHPSEPPIRHKRLLRRDGVVVRFCCELSLRFMHQRFNPWLNSVAHMALDSQSLMWQGGACLCRSR